MANVFVGDNDHGDVVPPTDVLLQMIKTLRTERDEARREIMLWVKERCSWVELAEEIKKRGWEYLKEDGK